VATYNGHQKLLAQIQADGLTTAFGNPGFSEEGLLDGIGRTPAIRYILGLQEAALALMASGYAMATNKPTVLRRLRRCVKIAATTPYGPTLLAVPQDILDAINDEPVVPTVVPETRVAPEPALIGRAAELLEGAENPVIIMGDGVSHAQAQGELALLAETLGAGVWGAMASKINIPWPTLASCQRWFPATAMLRSS